MTFIEATKLNDTYPFLGIWFEVAFCKTLEGNVLSEKYIKYDYANGGLVGFFLPSGTGFQVNSYPLAILIANQYKNKDGIYSIRMDVEYENGIYCVFIRNGKALMGSDRIYHEEDLDDIISLVGVEEIYDITNEAIF